jgi:hypothetical protein
VKDRAPGFLHFRIPSRGLKYSPSSRILNRRFLKFEKKRESDWNRFLEHRELVHQVRDWYRGAGAAIPVTDLVH